MGEESLCHHSSVSGFYWIRLGTHVFSFACVENQGEQGGSAAVTKKEALGGAEEPSQRVDWSPDAGGTAVVAQRLGRDMNQLVDRV
jgi:hypothetical protein